MKGFGNKNQSKQKKIYPLNNKNEDYKILNQAIKCQSEGNIVQAVKYYEFLIRKEFQESVVFANFERVYLIKNKINYSVTVN